jgi:chaperonin GroES
MQPINNNVLVCPNDSKQVTEGGIIIPETSQETSTIGKVEAVSIELYDDNGYELEPDINVGDTVIFSKFAGTDIEYEGRMCRMVKVIDIYAVVD